MTITATQLSTRQAPRKVRLVANTVKKLPLTDAVRQLSVINRRASIVVLKVLRQAIANATHNHGIKVEDLRIKTIQVDEGSRFRRFRAVSRGRAHGIIKRTSHIKVELETQQVAQPEKTATVAPSAPKEAPVAVVAEKSQSTEKAVKKTAKPAAKKKTTEKK